VEAVGKIETGVEFMDFKTFSKLIMIEQTLFALPFALLGVLFAGGGTVGVWIWVAVALAAARTAGMSFNRVIDADIDAKNPRTADRALPKGEISRGAVWLTAVAACLVFIFSAWMLNPLCFYLSFAGVFLLFVYSYFKRFSSSSHFFLGLIEAAAPVPGLISCMRWPTWILTAAITCTPCRSPWAGNGRLRSRRCATRSRWVP